MNNFTSKVNTALLMIIIGIAAWTLQKVVGMGEQLATTATTSAYQDAAILDIRARVSANEIRVQAVEVELAKLKH